MAMIWCERTDCENNDDHACMADMVDIGEDCECSTFVSIYDTVDGHYEPYVRTEHELLQERREDDREK